MNRSRTLGLSPTTTWLSPEERRASEYARNADERVTEYFKEHVGTVVRVLASQFRTHPREDVEEVVQDAFLRLFVKIKTGVEIESPVGWVIRTAHNLMLDRMRQDKSAEAVLNAYAVLVSGRDETPTIEEILCARERIAALRRAMKRLSELERECVQLRGRGLKLREIGARVGLDLRRVAEHIDKAVAYLETQVRD
jgi:RNA polymerase sigma factor (sigma-70 family)